MYFYIFDPKGDRETKYFERIQGRLLNLLAEFRIDGDTYRVSAIRTVDLLIEQAAGLDARTVVIVGSDETLNRAVNSLVKRNLQNKIIVGFIPLQSDSSLAHILGIPGDIEKAVKILAGRLIRELDLGKVGEHFFLSKIDLGENHFFKTEQGFFGLSAARRYMQLRPFIVKLSIEDSYTVTSEVLGVQIVNSRNNDGCKIHLGDPTDGLLDILFLGRMNSPRIFRYRKELASGCLDNVPGSTVMHARHVEILGPKKLPVAVEGSIYTKAPTVIDVAKEKIQMIVGRERQF